MCGFFGYLYHFRKPNMADVEHLYNATSLLTHRGPDDDGYYADDYIRIGFRRLSIIDVHGGQQPLAYDGERYWIAFNGEIYNYIELKERLKEQGYTFQTSSDTEVILALYCELGAEMLKHLRGMFAFVIWDKQRQRLFAARDSFGIKPFFYQNNERGMSFASEKKSLLQDHNDECSNQEALQHYFTFQYVPDPLTFSNDIKRLEPGHYLVKETGEPLRIVQYWQPRFFPTHRPLDHTVEKIRNILQDSVHMHMRSDVPVGAFLSGGIDSTAIVSLAKDIHPNLKTFSVGFDRDGFNETDIAGETADKFGVENIQKIIGPDEFVSALPNIIWHMDDAMADPSAIPLYFVAKEASKHLKVVLSGEGADELFGGYHIYREPLALKWFSLLSSPGNKALRKAAEKIPGQLKGKNYLLRGSTPLEQRYVGNAKIFSESEKRELLTHYDPRFPYENITRPLFKKIQYGDSVTKMQYIDLLTWLRGDILVKADKMTMAHSLELRVPFLDQEVFKVASQLSTADKIGDGTTKYALRKVMETIVPETVLHRKKLGFPVPIRHWLKDELYDWAYNLIQQSPTDLHIRKSVVFKMLEEHRKGKRDYSRKLWTVLTFMLWHNVYVEQSPLSPDVRRQPR
ncbi:asparagine synthase (glutamine-hydrolyzing) [Natribacillus halophilus]|uniref:asparagine synthase (glutamine-hydrolyzing) n=1 Tax=Natribacillus halophilus TaxID=549003 RepID=A0A1G8Q344_9BACI|nr:asparagine synthase (glutamine-hydrolyzing) [Natribacillus halophilus]SDI99179.1 asparagine synthase (glutamine-hydrolysing) [Natribacillus halophilus]